MWIWEWHIDGWLWTGLLIGYFILDGSCTRYTMYISKLKSIKAANTSVFILLLGILAPLIIFDTKNLFNVVPMAVGCWLGTFLTTEWEVILKRNGEKRSNSKDVAKGWLLSKVKQLRQLFTRKRVAR